MRSETMHSVVWCGAARCGAVHDACRLCVQMHKIVCALACVRMHTIARMHAYHKDDGAIRERKLACTTGVLQAQTDTYQNDIRAHPPTRARTQPCMHMHMDPHEVLMQA